MSVRKVHPVAVIGRAMRHWPAHLSEALDICLQLGIIPVMLEQTSTDAPNAVEAALGLIDEADVYIGVTGDEHVGSRSVTEAECEHASERGIPQLIVSPAASLKEFRAHLSEGLAGLGLRGRTREGSKPRGPEDASPRKKGGGDGNAKSAKPKTSPVGKSKQTFRVFVASPGDVRDERSRMPKVIESLNKTLGSLLNVVIELWRWEVDARPAAGEPQALINPELDAADVVLVIFWNRFGTPTSAGTTGTESEALRSLKRWSRVSRPQVMVYFCQRPATLDRPALEHRLKLLDFRERISPLVLADRLEAQGLQVGTLHRDLGRE